MTERSEIRIESLSLWDFDLDVLRDRLKTEGREYRRDSRRLVARKVISGAGEFPGKRTGRLQQTIAVKQFRSGLGFYITHKMKSNEFRYPFVLAYGSTKRGISPRKDHIAETVNARRAGTLMRIRESVRKSIKAEKIV